VTLDHFTRGLLVPSLMCAGLVLVLACEDDSPAEPGPAAQDLSGEWEYSFVARNPDPCPVEPVPVGCGGAGVLSFVQTGESVRGSYEVRGACQTCGVAADYGDSGALETLEVSNGQISFSLMSCQFTAPQPRQGDEVVRGDVSCSNPESSGSWQMTRKVTP